MPIYRVPVVIRGDAIVKYPDEKAVGEDTGGRPRDAEGEVCANTPYLVPRLNVTVELAGQTALIK